MHTNLWGRHHTVQSTLFDPEKLGREMLALTNQFRAKNKLSPLRWNQGVTLTIHSLCAHCTLTIHPLRWWAQPSSTPETWVMAKCPSRIRGSMSESPSSHFRITVLVKMLQCHKGILRWLVLPRFVKAQAVSVGCSDRSRWLDSGQS